jgi:hypothetical protein
MRQPLRHARLAHLGAAALRLLYATLDPRRRRHARLLFQRPALGVARGHSWIPRAWFARFGRVFAFSRGQTLRVYRGRRWRRLAVQRWHIGLSWGAFARSTALAVFKKKSSAKKRRRRQSGDGGASLGLRIQQIREVRAGVRRRSSVQFDPQMEAQLRGLG